MLFRRSDSNPEALLRLQQSYGASVRERPLLPGLPTIRLTPPRELGTWLLTLFPSDGTVTTGKDTSFDPSDGTGRVTPAPGDGTASFRATERFFCLSGS